MGTVRYLLALSCLLLIGNQVPALETYNDPLYVEVLYISRNLIGAGRVKAHIPRMVSNDPSIRMTAVPMPGHYSIGHLQQDPDAINRVMRMYMPRTYLQLTGRWDLILMNDASCGSLTLPEVYFDQKWMKWFVDAVEGGMALSMWGGDASWGGGGEGSYRSWRETLLDEILPFASLGGYNPSSAGVQKPSFADEDHPLAGLPWRGAGSVELLNRVNTRQGASLVSEAIAPGRAYPWIAWWEIGGGKVTGETQVFGSKGTSNRMLGEWEWYQDFLIYLVYFCVDRPIPSDLVRVHDVRSELNAHVDEYSLFVSLLNFIEKFGADTGRLYEELEGLDDLRMEAEGLYLEGDYDGAGRVIDILHDRRIELGDRAVDMKERALLWIYIIEWSAVTAVTLITGVVLWQLMVRRRLYREIRLTRTN